MFGDIENGAKRRIDRIHETHVEYYLLVYHYGILAKTDSQQRIIILRYTG